MIVASTILPTHGLPANRLPVHDTVPGLAEVRVETDEQGLACLRLCEALAEQPYGVALTLANRRRDRILA
jgi:hypothetical protein